MSNEQRKIEWPGWDEPKIIGRGSFGEVYEIQRNVFGDIEKAALKVISIPKDEVDIEDYYYEGFDKESLSMMFDQHLHSIVKEYSTMKKLSGCKNVVSCDDVRYVQHSNGIGWDIFIKMELLTPLGRCFKKYVPEKEIIKIGIDICNALEVCQKNNIIHRDIKPQNILRSDFGDYKLGDFGIAKTIEKTTGGTKIGTYDYMAPEIFNNQPYGYKADLYSLGLVLYWLANEKVLPFLSTVPTVDMKDQANRRRFLGEAIPAPKHGSEALKHVILKACSYNESDRFQNAAEMKKALISVLRRNLPPPPPKEVDQPPKKPDQPLKKPDLPPQPTPTPKPPLIKLILAISASLAVIVFAVIIGLSSTKRVSEADLTNSSVSIATTTEVAVGGDVDDNNDESTKIEEPTKIDNINNSKGEQHDDDSNNKSSGDNDVTTSELTANVPPTKNNAQNGTKKEPIKDKNDPPQSPDDETPANDTITSATIITTTSSVVSQQYYEVKLYCNGGMIQGKQNYTLKVIEGTTIGSLTKPVRENYRFLGWVESLNSSKILDYNTKIYKVYTLYAKWESNIVNTTTTTTTTKNNSNTYRITLKYNNKTEPITVPAGAQLYKYLPHPTRSNCTFAGWVTYEYKDVETENCVFINRTDTADKDLELYAKWKLAYDIPALQ